MQTLHPPSAAKVGTSQGGGEAWLLDVDAFHREVDDLFAALAAGEGPTPMRRRATELWHSDDPVVAGYVSRLATDTPDEWAVAFEERHLGQWYRLLMAGHLEPARGLRAPDVVRRRLPALGFSPAYARRLAFGRELVELAESRASAPVAAAMGLTLPHGHKGWLDAEDLTFALERLRAVDRRAFRHAQDLVPLCEDLWAVLSEAAVHPEAVLLLGPS